MLTRISPVRFGQDASGLICDLVARDEERQQQPSANGNVAGSLLRRLQLAAALLDTLGTRGYSIQHIRSIATFRLAASAVRTAGFTISNQPANERTGLSWLSCGQDELFSCAARVMARTASSVQAGGTTGLQCLLPSADMPPLAATLAAAAGSAAGADALLTLVTLAAVSSAHMQHTTAAVRAAAAPSRFLASLERVAQQKVLNGRAELGRSVRGCLVQLAATAAEAMGREAAAAGLSGAPAVVRLAAAELLNVPLQSAAGALQLVELAAQHVPQDRLRQLLHVLMRQSGVDVQPLLRCVAALLEAQPEGWCADNLTAEGLMPQLSEGLAAALCSGSTALPQPLVRLAARLCALLAASQGSSLVGHLPLAKAMLEAAQRASEPQVASLLRGAVELMRAALHHGGHVYGTSEGLRRLQPALLRALSALAAGLESGTSCSGDVASTAGLLSRGLGLASEMAEQLAW